MCAVSKATPQKEMLPGLIRLLKSKLKKKDIDYWSEVPCSEKAPKGYEAVEIVFRPKETK